MIRTTDKGYLCSSQRFTVGALVIALTLVAGCAGLRQRREAVDPSGFLRDYSQLRENDQYKAYLTYVNPAANWSKYKAIMIDSVAFWGNPDDKISQEDQQMVAGLMFNALYDTLGKHFAIATAPATNVLRLRAAVTEAKGSKVALNVVTSVIPQLRLVSSIGGMAADTSAIVGEAGAEFEALDSASNVRLAAAVDRQTGTKALIHGGSKFSKWGDVQAACEYWAERIDKFLAEKGVRQVGGSR